MRLSAFLERTLALLFPPQCIGCAKPGSTLCGACAAALPRANGADLSSEAYAALDYRNKTVKRLIWHVKYRNKAVLADQLAALLFEDALEALTEDMVFSKDEAILIVPIPASRKRLRQYGFNHAALIARRLAQRLPMKSRTEEMLKRRREVPSQVSLASRTKRLVNMEGVFYAPEPSRITGRTILIVDDVTTTGATMHDARRALEEAGARRVFCIAAAH